MIYSHFILERICQTYVKPYPELRFHVPNYALSVVRVWFSKAKPYPGMFGRGRLWLVHRKYQFVNENLTQAMKVKTQGAINLGCGSWWFPLWTFQEQSFWSKHIQTDSRVIIWVFVIQRRKNNRCYNSSNHVYVFLFTLGRSCFNFVCVTICSGCNFWMSWHRNFFYGKVQFTPIKVSRIKFTEWNSFLLFVHIFEGFVSNLRISVGETSFNRSDSGRGIEGNNEDCCLQLNVNFRLLNTIFWCIELKTVRVDSCHAYMKAI